MLPAPRPVLVTRKPPVFRRKSVLYPMAGVVVVAVVIGVLIALHASSVRSFKAKQAAGVTRFSDQVTAKVPKDAQSVGSTLFLFPSARSGLDDLASGKVKPADSLTQAEAYAAEAKTSADAISAIRTQSMIASNFTLSTSTVRAPGLTRRSLNDAQYLMVKGLRMYQQVFALWETAAAPDTPDAVRKDMAARCEDHRNDRRAALRPGLDRVHPGPQPGGVAFTRTVQPTAAAALALTDPRARTERQPLGIARWPTACCSSTRSRSTAGCGSRSWPRSAVRSPSVAPHLPGFGGTPGAGAVMTMAPRPRAAASRRSTGPGSSVSRRLRALDGRVRGVRALAPGARPVRGACCSRTPAPAPTTPSGAAGRRALAARLRPEGNGFLVESPPPLLSEMRRDELRRRVRG